MFVFENKCSGRLGLTMGKLSLSYRFIRSTYQCKLLDTRNYDYLEWLNKRAVPISNQLIIHFISVNSAISFLLSTAERVKENRLRLMPVLSSSDKYFIHP